MGGKEQKSSLFGGMQSIILFCVTGSVPTIPQDLAHVSSHYMELMPPLETGWRMEGKW